MFITKTQLNHQPGINDEQSLANNHSFTLPDQIIKGLKIVDWDTRFRAVSPRPIPSFKHEQNPNHGQ